MHKAVAISRGTWGNTGALQFSVDRIIVVAGTFTELLNYDGRILVHIDYTWKAFKTPVSNRVTQSEYHI